MRKAIWTALLACVLAGGMAAAAFGETTVLRGTPPNRANTAGPGDANADGTGGAAGQGDVSNAPGSAGTGGDTGNAPYLTGPPGLPGGAAAARPGGKLVSPEATQPPAAR